MFPVELAARYSVLQRYAGGEGETVRARELSVQGREVVIKLLAADVPAAAREGILLTSLTHPAIPAVLDGGRLADGRTFLVREFIAGADLTQDPPEDGAAIRFMTERLLEVLAHVHGRGVLHLDLKPGNVIRRRAARGAGSQYFLLDFGLARRGAPRDGEGPAGTPFFVAPEVLLGGVPDERADLFSLGALVLVLVTRERPIPLRAFLRRFPAEDFLPAAGLKPDDLPEQWRGFLVRSLARDPRDRFRSAEDALEFLSGGNTGAGIRPLRLDPVECRRAELETLARYLEEPGAELWLSAPAGEATAQAALFLALRGQGRIAGHEDATLRIVGSRGGNPRIREAALPMVRAPELAQELNRMLALQPAQAETAARLLVQRTGGDPDDISRLLQEAAATRRIVAEGGRWFWPSAAAGSPELPADATRVAAPADPDERALLHLLGIAGEPLHPALLDQDGSRRSALARLLQTHRVVRRADGRIGLRGPAVAADQLQQRQAHAELARALPAGELRDAHRALAGESLSTEELLRTVRDLYGSGRAELARALMGKAAGQGSEHTPLWVEASRHEEALGEPQRALRWLSARDEPAALALRCGILARMGETQAVEPLLPRLPAEDADRIRAFLASLRGEHERALAILQARPLPEAAPARAEDAMARGLCLARMGRLTEARAILEQAIQAAQQIGATAVEAGCFANLGVLLLRAGAPAEALAAHRQSLDRFRRMGHMRQVGIALANIGVTLKELGRFRDAEEMHRQALAVRRRAADRAGEAASLASLGMVRLDQGRGREAAELFAQSQQAATAADATATARLAHAQRIQAMCLAGDVPGAQELVKRLPRGPGGTLETGDQMALAWVSLASGDVAAARDCARHARQGWESAHDLRSVARVEAFLQQLDDGVADPATAEALLEQARAEGDAGSRLRALALRTVAQGRGPLPPEAQALLAELVPEPERRETALRVILGPALADQLDALARPPAEMPPATTQSTEVFRTLLAINRRLATERDLPGCLRYLLDSAVTLSGARRGFLLLLENGQPVQELSSGQSDAAEVQMSRSVVLRAIAQGRPIVSDDALKDQDLMALATVRQLELRSLLCVPFATPGGERGALYVEHRGRSSVFDEHAEALLEMLADQAAIAIDRLKREEELRSANRSLEAELARSHRDLEVVRRRLGSTPEHHEVILGKSAPVEKLRQEIARLAPTDLSILILGETGSGKELVARALHRQSRRASGPFVSENCSAIPEALMESELFGHAKGAFTGAEQAKKGLLELAHEGTLFLDEIGDMPLPLQAKLLRVLEEGEIRPVGSTVSRHVDLRVVAATHRDLPAEAKAGRFREDLLYRLMAAVVRVPPLRERGEDIKLLAQEFLRRLNEQHRTRKRFAKETLELFEQGGWPGNVRELQHAVARIYLMTMDETILPDASLVQSRPAAGGAAVESGAPAPGGGTVRPLAQLELDAIRHALQVAGGDKTRTAKLLGISRTALYEKIKKL